MKMKLNPKRLLLPLFLIAIPFTYGLKKMGEFLYSWRRPSYGFFDDYYRDRITLRMFRVLVSGLGGYAAGMGGAALGALIGTLAFPGIGTAVGGLVGAILGTCFGLSFGNWILRQVVRELLRLQEGESGYGHPNLEKYQPDSQNGHAQMRTSDVRAMLNAFSEKRREDKKKLSRWVRVSSFFASEQDKKILKEIEYLDYATGKVRNRDIVGIDMLVKTTYMAALPRNAKAYRPAMQFSISKSALGLWSKLEVSPYQDPSSRQLTSRELTSRELTSKQLASMQHALRPFASRKPK